MLISKGAMTDSNHNNPHILGYHEWYASQNLWHLSQTVYTVCFYSVYRSMSLVDTWLQPLWLVCLMVPDPLWFPSPPWWWCEAQRWQSLHKGFHLHSSRSMLKSSGFKFMLSTNINNMLFIATENNYLNNLINISNIKLILFKTMM